ncbi:hypothetical protein SNE40_023677 [Patella caerulea]|uniref:BEN domain-containing protein n=1 Tax=Patella caerulea TaxID=87958 RepID=A0AAN8IX74_PATCE
MQEVPKATITCRFQPKWKELIDYLMSMLWTKEILSSHSLTGKTANPKPCLDFDMVTSLCGKLIFVS